MQFKILKPQSTEAFLIEKRKAGSIRIELWSTFPVSGYLITESGYSALKSEKKILLKHTVYKIDNATNFSKVISLSPGNYYLIVVNKGDSEANYNFDISENFEPPGYTSVSGISGTFIR